MHRLHIAHLLRTVTFVVTAACVAALVVGVLWVNQSGLPDSWRLAIERQISERHGLHLKIGSLSYNPLRGIIAGQVRIYDSADLKREISRAESLIFDFDNTQLARGSVRLDKVVLSNATVSLPIDPANANSELLEITQANGTFVLPAERQIVIRNAHGMLQGIKVTLNARFTSGPRRSGPASNPATREHDNQIASRIIRELRKWSFDPDQPPQLRIFAEGTPGKTSGLTARLSFSASALEKNQHRLDEVTAEAEITGNLLNVTSLHARDGERVLDAHLDFDLNRQAGRFDVRSSLEIPPLLESWFELPPARDMLVAGRQEVEASGTFTLEAEHPVRVHMTGRARCESTMVRGIRFDSAECAFAWLDGGLFLKDLLLSRPDGKASGKALIQWPMVRIAIDSTLPPGIYQPLFAGKVLGKVIERFDTDERSRLHLTLEGGFDATDRSSWAYSGHGSGQHLRYHGIPVHSASCHFSLSARQLHFSDGDVTFDYTGYPLQAAFDGPLRGNATFSNIHYTHADRLVTIERIGGTLWPAPLVRMFAPKVADLLESYRFHTPPRLDATGRIDTSGRDRTRLDIDFTSDSAANYTLLGADVTLAHPRGSVSIRGRDVAVTGLDVGVFKGTATANLRFDHQQPLAAEVQWTKLALDEIASCYQLKIDCGGEITGRTEFSMNKGDLASLNGNGLCAVERSELFSVPMFGPLSMVISGVLRDRRAGFERAKSAFCSFDIQQGILRTDDFSTATSSLVFAGDGTVNLVNRTLDMTMRVNARGLLGLITLPIRPFYGMFQFRGTGPINDTQWEHVMFTDPSDAQRKLLLEAPKAKIVDPGG